MALPVATPDNPTLGHSRFVTYQESLTMSGRT